MIITAIIIIKKEMKYFIDFSASCSCSSSSSTSSSCSVHLRNFLDFFIFATFFFIIWFKIFLTIFLIKLERLKSGKVKNHASQPN